MKYKFTPENVNGNILFQEGGQYYAEDIGVKNSTIFIREYTDNKIVISIVDKENGKTQLVASNTKLKLVESGLNNLTYVKFNDD